MTDILTGNPELLLSVSALFSEALSRLEAGLTGRSFRDRTFDELFLKGK